MTVVIAVFAAWLVVGVVLSARWGARAAGPSGSGRLAGAVAGAFVALPPEISWSIVAAAAVLSWTAL
ncbi:hypothetical protein [Rubrivirga sp. IMCC43871]|uniref:hypothetical protein n=1 Tax=Rubrivirga sp. IMCC43871 TaxID=3391575 RepID=UPI0039901720